MGKRFTKKHLEVIGQLDELFEMEHGGCDQYTCTMTAAYNAGYSLVAIEDFSHSGASSPEFDKLYNKLPKRLWRAAVIKESKKFCKEVEHDECRKCNAVIWHGGAYRTEVYCDSCGHSWEKDSIREIILRAAEKYTEAEAV